MILHHTHRTLLLTAVLGALLLVGPASSADASHVGEATPLPGGATQIFPRHRVVSLYGAPQMSSTILGRLSTTEAGRLVRRETDRYRVAGQPKPIPAFTLAAVMATNSPGRDGRYRFRQSASTITRYLRAARKANARLILEIQPGRSSFGAEAKRLERWLRAPDVDLALDAEWNVGRRGVPRRTQGSVSAREINGVHDWLAALGRRRGLPQKLLVVHQFRREATRSSRRRWARRAVAAVTAEPSATAACTARRPAPGSRARRRRRRRRSPRSRAAR